MLKNLTKFDFYRRTSSDIAQQTVLGGILSVISLSIMFLLFLSETYSYLLGPYIPHPIVEGLPSTSRIRVDLNISFFHIPCELLSVHYSDSTGSHFPASEIVMLSLGKNGNILTDRVEEVRQWSDTRKNSDCGSCYGAELYEGQCCNTCEEVYEAYAKKSWAPPNRNIIEQCRRKLREVDRPVGCQAYGNLMVRRVPGNIHGSLNPIGQLIVATGKGQIDGSHRINSILFSDPEHESPVSTHLSNYGVFGKDITKYYLKLSPAVYPNGVRFYEASAQSHSLDVVDSPEISFHFDIEPLTTTYKYRKSFSSYIVSLCAIIGGWYALTTFFSRIIMKSG